MEQKVQFTIGSVFKGEGFKKAQQAIKTTNAAAKQSLGVMNQLVSAIGMSNQKYAQAANAVSGLISAISSGNPVMIAMQVAMSGIALWSAKVEKRIQALKDKTDALAESSRQALESARSGYFENLNNEMKTTLSLVQKIMDEFDETTKRANTIRGYLEKSGSSQNEMKIIQMEISKLQKLSETSEVDSGVVEAQENLKILLEKRAQAEDKARTAIEKVNQERIDAEGRIAKYDEQIALLVKQIQNNDKEIADVGEVDSVIAKKLAEENKRLAEKREMLIAAQEKERRDIETYGYKLTAAKEEYEKEILESKKSTIEAREKIKEAEDKRVEAIQAAAEEEQKQLEEKKKRAEEYAKKQAELAKKEEDAKRKRIEEEERQRKEYAAAASGYGYGNNDGGNHMSTIRPGFSEAPSQIQDALTGLATGKNTESDVDALIHNMAYANTDPKEAARQERYLQRAKRDAMSSTHFKRTAEGAKGSKPKNEPVHAKWAKQASGGSDGGSDGGSAETVSAEQKSGEYSDVLKSISDSVESIKTKLEDVGLK